MTKIWVLTSDENQYDDRGNFFIAAFAKKPTIKQLADVMKEKAFSAQNVMEAVALLEHIREGGGRRGTENTWYHLTEEELK